MYEARHGDRRGKARTALGRRDIAVSGREELVFDKARLLSSDVALVERLRRLDHVVVQFSNPAVHEAQGYTRLREPRPIPRPRQDGPA
jgi:hypothetical protein